MRQNHYKVQRRFRCWKCDKPLTKNQRRAGQYHCAECIADLGLEESRISKAIRWENLKCRVF